MTDSTPARVNKAALVSAVAAETSMAARDVARVLDTTLDTIARTVTAGGSVSISNFGTWLARTLPPRMVRNPQTGELRHQPARTVARFRIAPRFQTTVQGADPAAATVRKRPKSR
ncbi:HU family DNA-binding protein [Streptomyces abikoensis]|uniref:HU family DNA-binding protein n=1 Tax=Streptomyces abikoensis TaxID=97398 RepID=A0ABW7TCF9_9ACTN